MLGPHAIETELAYHATTVRWIVWTSIKSAGGPQWNKTAHACNFAKADS